MKSQILGGYLGLKNLFRGTKNLLRGTKKPGTAGLIWAFVRNTETGGVWEAFICASCHLAFPSKIVYTIHVS